MKYCTLFRHDLLHGITNTCLRKHIYTKHHGMMQEICMCLLTHVHCRKIVTCFACFFVCVFSVVDFFYCSYSHSFRKIFVVVFAYFCQDLCVTGKLSKCLCILVLRWDHTAQFISSTRYLPPHPPPPKKTTTSNNK